MIAMAIGRFCADSLAERLKLKRVLVASGILMTAGLLVAVVLDGDAPANVRVHIDWCWCIVGGAVGL